jgi:TPP-dependent pyruvate/acetoin dehydrogenase alpha subunit
VKTKELLSQYESQAFLVEHTSKQKLPLSAKTKTMIAAIDAAKTEVLKRSDDSIVESTTSYLMVREFDSMLSTLQKENVTAAEVANIGQKAAIVKSSLKSLQNHL